MIGYSSVILIGTLASDPQFHTTPTGTLVASFTVLVIRRRPHPGRPGHYMSQWTYVPVTAFNQNAETIGEYAKRGGSRIFIDGHLEEQRDHTRRPAPLGVIVDHLNFLDNPPDEPPTPDGKSTSEDTATP